jgi:hypothetical protein
MSPWPGRRVRVALLATAAVAAVAATLPDGDDAPIDTRSDADSPPSARRGAAAIASPTAAAWPEPAPRLKSDTSPSATALAAWGPPPAPPVARALVMVGPTVPTAPAFGYTLIGRIDEAQAARAVLHNERRSITVATGDIIDGEWRVEAVEPTRVTVLWLPTQRRQVISLAGQ